MARFLSGLSASLYLESERVPANLLHGAYSVACLHFWRGMSSPEQLSLHLSCHSVQTEDQDSVDRPVCHPWQVDPPAAHPRGILFFLLSSADARCSASAMPVRSSASFGFSRSFSGSDPYCCLLGWAEQSRGEASSI